MRCWCERECAGAIARPNVQGVRCCCHVFELELHDLSGGNRIRGHALLHGAAGITIMHVPERQLPRRGVACQSERESCSSA